MARPPYICLLSVQQFISSSILMSFDDSCPLTTRLESLWAKMFLFFVALLFIVQQSHAVPNFDSGHQVGTVTSHSIREESGLCASRQHSNVLYTHNDSGAGPEIYAIDATNGHRLATIHINNAHSHDWEDIACGPCGNGGNCVYVGDTGGNAGNYEANVIYRIREPDHFSNYMNLNFDSSLHYSWPEHDCETLMVDPRGEVYVVSKQHYGYGKIYQLPKSAWGHSHATYVSGGVTVPVHTNSYGPVGGDISPDGHEVLLKTYGHVYYFSVPDGNIINGLSHHGTALTYHPERQGESVCWDSQGHGYYTVSEGTNSPLYYHRKY